MNCFYLVFILLNLICFYSIQCLYFGYSLDKLNPKLEKQYIEKLENELYKIELEEENLKQPVWEQRLVKIYEDSNWPANKTILKRLNQIAGIAHSKNGILYVFHRGNRNWNIYTNLKKITKPIEEDTVLMLNSTTGSLINSWGKNLFYMPHGISLDKEDNVWLTDVVTHQVYRFKNKEYNFPELILGEKFTAGTDEYHFCMPTDISIASNGFVYISDGYCNSRVVIFAPNGMLIQQIAYQDGIIIPHSLTLLENEDLICVADREDQRVLCYTAGLTKQKSGELIFSIKHPSMKKVFAIESLNDLLFALNGPALSSLETTANNLNDDQPVGLIIDLATEKMLTSFYPQNNFISPHDMTIDKKTKTLFVSDLESPSKIFKFNIF